MNKIIKKTFTFQRDQADCGVTCLLSILKYYGGFNTINYLREHSGTDSQGTTLLGLYQAASKIGLDAKGVEANVQSLIKYSKPAILQILKDEQLEHYIIFYGIHQNKIIIGDPASGIEFYTKEQLDQVWKSKYCLLLSPNNDFKNANEQKNLKTKWFIELIHHDRNIIFSSIFLGIIISILSMVTAIFSQKLIDNILPSKNINSLIISIGILMFIFLIKGLFSYLHNIFFIRQSKDFNNRIVSYFYNSLLKLPKSFFDTRTIGDMVARLNDTSRIQSFIAHLVGSIIIDSFMFIVSMSFIFYYSTFLGIFSLLFFCLFFFIIKNNSKDIIEQQTQIMSTYSHVETNYINTIKGITEIKNFNKNNLFESQNTSIYSNHQKQIFTLGKVRAGINLQYNLLSSAFITIILAVGAYSVMFGNIKLGVFMAILGISSSLIPYVMNLAMIIIPFSAAKIAFERMYEFTGIEKEEEEEEEEEEGMDSFTFEKIEVKNLSFRYPGRKLVLDDFSINIRKGEIIALLGESGCGKSTLTQILGKFYKYEKGSILLNDSINLNLVNINKWREIIAIVPQDIHIFNGTVLENIAMEFNDVNYEKVMKFINDIGLIKFINELPSGIMTMVGEIGINLSGGQKQLIAIARSLYKQPRLLILDEVTSALDTEKENYILQILQNINNNVGILFITHRIHILRNFADKIYVIENGSIQIAGKHEQLLLTDNMYSRFWNRFSIFKKETIETR